MASALDRGTRPWLPVLHQVQGVTDSRKFLLPYKRIRQQQRSISLEKEELKEERGELLALALARSPRWFPVFDEMVPSMEELTHAQERLQLQQPKDFSRRAIALGDLLLLQGSFDEAEASFQRAISSTATAGDLDEENRVTAQVKLGMLLENLGRLDEAEFQLKQASSTGATITGATHYGALKFLQLFLFDHGTASAYRDLSASIDSCWEFRKWWSAASTGHPLYESPYGFVDDLSFAWFGRLRLGLVHKLVTKKLKLANQNLFVAHTSHRTHSLLAVHLRRVGEVRDHWFKLVSLDGVPVESPEKHSKYWTEEDDRRLLERVAFQDPKSILSHRLVCKTPLWEL